VWILIGTANKRLSRICCSIHNTSYDHLHSLQSKTMARHRRRSKKERQGFHGDVMESILHKQNHRCAKCNRILNVVDYHHKNGDRSDNRVKLSSLVSQLSCRYNKKKRTSLNISQALTRFG
jgi:hypothetical protein